MASRAKEKEVRLTEVQEAVLFDQLLQLGMPKNQVLRAFKAMVPGSKVFDRFEQRGQYFGPASAYARETYDAEARKQKEADRRHEEAEKRKRLRASCAKYFARCRKPTQVTKKLAEKNARMWKAV